VDGFGPLPWRQGQGLNRNVVTPKSANEALCEANIQLSCNVVLHFRCCGCRERNYWCRPEHGQARTEHAILGPKVVAPLADAVRFIYCDERERAFGEHLWKSGNC
jgi:hypothetical protein